MKRSATMKAMVFLISVFLLEGFIVCASAAETEKQLSKKVAIVWKAKVDGDWGTVYDMGSSAYKKTVKRGEFLAGNRPRIVDYSIKEIKILEPKQKARAIVNYKLEFMSSTFNATAEDEWLMEKGKWVIDLSPAASMKQAFPGSP